MTTAPEPAESAPPRAVFTFRVSSLAWIVVVAVFLLLRIGPVWRAPVNGSELIHLSGAWQAHLRVSDARFVPTLFQALTALTFHWTTSEVPARILAFAATASIPGALYLLRPRIGEAGALVALLLLAFDAPGLLVGSQASALGFDLPLSLWLFVLMTRPPGWRWAPPLAAFLAAVSGPLALPLVFAWAASRLWRREHSRSRQAGFTAAALLLGILVTSFRFGLGWDHLVIAPVRLFADGYDQRWSTATGTDAFLIYAWPLLVTAAVALGLVGSRRWPIRGLDPHDQVLGGWALASLAWALSSSQSHTIVPLVALTTPAAIFLGPALARGVSAMVRADWTTARFLVPAAGFLGLLAIAISINWARLGYAPVSQRVFIVLLIALMGVGIASVAALPQGRPSLVACGVAALLPLLAGTMGIALSVNEAPLLSPTITAQARQLRDIALQKAADQHGLVVVHTSLADDITWPFRDSGTLVVATRIPPDAMVAIWPQGLAKPDGMDPLEGDWALATEVDQPAGTFLQYLHWLIDRRSVTTSPLGIAVYVRTPQ
ncbi:MAG TPA: hypothetical protein VIK11_07120 [Tepidiformaceae bacterium]